MILGTGFDVGGVEELPPPPPPQDTEMAKESATRIEVTTRRAMSVLERTASASFDTAGYLLLDSLGSRPHASNRITTPDELNAQFNVHALLLHIGNLAIREDDFHVLVDVNLLRPQFDNLLRPAENGLNLLGSLP